MPLRIAGHGGGCCGIRHMFTFANYSLIDGTREEFILQALDGIVKSFVPDNGGHCTCVSCQRARDPVKIKARQDGWITAVECVLAGDQYKTWKEPLEKCGFKEVFSFKNSNSSNMCHVFYGTTNPVVMAVKEAKDVESAPKDTEITI